MRIIVLSVLKTLGRVAGCTLLYLVGFDIAGVLACLLLDVLSFGDSNTSAYYALWFVLGILCGLFSYNTAGRVASPKSTPDGMPWGTNPTGTEQDWTSREDSGRTGLLVVFTTVLVLGALSVPCFLIGSWDSVEPSGFVPDNAPLTLTFFVAVLAATIFAHTSLRPKPKNRA